MDTAIFSRVLYQLSYLGEELYSTFGVGVCQEKEAPRGGFVLSAGGEKATLNKAWSLVRG